MNAPTIPQIKSWLFALACRIKPALSLASIEKYKGLYEKGKEFLGTKSLVFNDFWLKTVRRERYGTCESSYGHTLLFSFENGERRLQSYLRNLMRYTNPMFLYVNVELVKCDVTDVTQKLTPHTKPVSGEVYELAKEIFTNENWETKGILADALEDMDAITDATHIRDSACTIACPVLQRLLRRKK